MIADIQIPEPVLFNPIKHHLGFMREFINHCTDGFVPDNKILLKELKHLGTSVMDVYTGLLSIEDICTGVKKFLADNNISEIERFSHWVGKEVNCYRIIPLSDDSQWTLKYHDNNLRFVHIFPARSSKNTFRIKSNTLKSALIYHALIGKDYVTGADLNKVRTFLDLSPVKEIEDSAAISGMIEILRDKQE